MKKPVVVSAGQCSFDTGQLRSLVNRAGGELHATESVEDTIEFCLKAAPSLILLNRVFDRTGESGITAIGTINTLDELSQIPLMLVSNYPDYQAEAVRKGAVPGFGKSQLHETAVVAQVQAYLTR